MNAVALLSATTPAALEAAQANMVRWCDERIAECEAIRREAEDLLGLAREGVLGLPPAVDRRRRLAVKRVEFYRKVRAALRAGYYLVPNFPLERIAVRVRENRTPRSKASTWGSGHEQRADLLPIGEGRWVSPAPELRSWTVDVPAKDTQPAKRVTYYTADEFAEPEFPVALVSREVIEAAERAVSEKFFDEVGYCRDWNAGGDPILVGRVLNPRQGASAVTFFLAWWLDLRRL